MVNKTNCSLIIYKSLQHLENATMFQIQDMFENKKPNIVLKLLRDLL